MKKDYFKLMLLAAVMLMQAVAVSAAPVDAATALEKASGFMHSCQAGKKAAPAVSLRLAHAQQSAMNAAQTDYYVFNATDASGFVIVAGDDRAQAILGYGDGAFDRQRVPEGLEYLLNLYRDYMEYLFSNPSLVPAKAASDVLPRPTVDPMLTAMWSQSEPYYNECPVYDGQYCVTGCSCTSLSMVFYHWKYPTGTTPAVPAYVTSNLGLSLAALKPTTFDWDNMIDVYAPGYYTEEQAAAVAHLMRYVGQAERMDYSPEGSGASGNNIVSAAKLFGYDDGAKILFKSNWWGEELFNDVEWDCIMHDELEAGRPMVYIGYDRTFTGGHAFNVDGYDSDKKMYHVNFGWGGHSNGYYVLNGFGEYVAYQQMVIGLQRPLTKPTIVPQMSRLYMDCQVGKQMMLPMIVAGRLMNGPVSLTLNDESGYFSLNTDQLTMRDLSQGNPAYVTYKPMFSGTHVATITLKSSGAEDVKVTLIGVAKLETYTPELLPPGQLSSTSVMAQWLDNTPAVNLDSYCLELNALPYSDLRLEEYFNKGGYDGSSSSDCNNRLDEITSSPGWTGRRVYYNNEYMTIGGANTGWLETPQVNMAGNGGMVTVKVNARCPSSNASSMLMISCGDSDTTLLVGPEEAEYPVLLRVPANVPASVRLGTRVKAQKVLLTQVKVYAGDDYLPVKPEEAKRYESIHGNSFQINGLIGGNYAMRIQALYIDGTTSDWTDYERFNVEGDRVDVNRDGEVNIIDVNTIIDFLLVGGNLTTGDVNGDGEVNIADVNAVIDRILEGTER